MKVLDVIIVSLINWILTITIGIILLPLIYSVIDFLQSDEEITILFFVLVIWSINDKIIERLYIKYIL